MSYQYYPVKLHQAGLSEMLGANALDGTQMLVFQFQSTMPGAMVKDHECLSPFFAMTLPDAVAFAKIFTDGMQALLKDQVARQNQESTP